MITHERLKELIEQESGCYVLNDYSIGYVHLKSKYEPETYVNGLEDYILYIYCNDKKEYKEEIFSEQLFETEEEAEWHKEFGCIERTVKLDLPKWEDIEKDKKFHYIRHFVLSKNFSFFIEIYKFTNTIGVSWSGGCKKTDPRFDRTWELTKENYFEACRKAKELFLGEE